MSICVEVFIEPFSIIFLKLHILFYWQIIGSVFKGGFKKYFNTYYVPNNMVIALSGDFDPDQAIKIINETHSMRYLFIPEIELIAKDFIIINSFENENLSCRSRLCCIRLR